MFSNRWTDGAEQKSRGALRALFRAGALRTDAGLQGVTRTAPTRKFDSTANPAKIVQTGKRVKTQSGKIF